MKRTFFAQSSIAQSSISVIRSVLAAALLPSLVIAVALAVFPAIAFSQTPPPVNFISGKVFSGVGYGDRIPGAANVYTFAVGDFSHDGKLDLVTTNNSNQRGLGLVLGNGDGTFQPPSAIAGFNIYGVGYGGIVAGDFNKDSNLDFAVLWLDPGGILQVGIYLNDGVGHLTLGNTYAIGNAVGHVPRSVTAADLNGDGTLDLIVPDVSNWAVAVLYGKGDGTFPTSAEFAAAVPNVTAPTGVAVGDFNKDGKPDIVVASSTGCCPLGGGITVLMNNGNGTFGLPVLYPNKSGVDSGQVAVADLNADGKLDVVETSMGGQNVAVFLGNGNGTFQAAKITSVAWPSAVAVGNLTSDNKPELVVSSYYDGTAWVLLNKGSGVFVVSGVYSSDLYPMAIALADFNGDKKLDFVAGNSNGQFATIALGNGDGTFQDSPHYNESGGMWTNGIAVADFNLDGSLDIVQAGGGTGVGLSLMLGTPNGVFKAPTFIALGASSYAQVTFVRAIDVNADGKPDIVCGTPKGVAVLLGFGTGIFKTPVTYAVSPSSYPVVGWLADVNGDGKPDIVTSNNDGTMSVLLNKGNGVYGTATVFPSGTGAYASGFVLGDFNHDGKVDIVVGDFQASDLLLLLGNGNGTFQSPVVLPSPVRPGDPIAADFNKDGKLDLAIVSNDSGGSLAILLGNGNGTFTNGATYKFFDNSTCLIPSACAHYPISLVTVDLNGDNNLDLAIAPRNPWYNTCGGYRCAEEYLGAVVYLGKGDATFVEQSGWLAGISPTWVVAADFNNDGMPDLAFLSTDVNYGQTSVTILQNATQPLSVSPLSVIFLGTKNVFTSTVQTVVLTNNQSATLTISSIVLTGANRADYSAKSNCGTALGPGLHCTITVTFKPLAPLARTASLVITDSVGTQTVPLTGVATEVKLSPTALAFGSVMVGQTKSLPVTLSNIGTSAFSILSPGIVITGTAAADYSQTNTCGTSVAGGSNCTINVTFKPSKKGARGATLNINDNGGPSPQKVALSGTGV
ncbi:MAG: FG-GAP-like repeat-containing protein [Acidobacteriia bacterium]|nr:FG-GAP-like repeat-containing protein [Terriglobia bacterium]